MIDDSSNYAYSDSQAKADKETIANALDSILLGRSMILRENKRLREVVKVARKFRCDPPYVVAGFSGCAINCIGCELGRALDALDRGKEKKHE